MADTFRPPEGAATAAKRALRWIKEGHAGGGFTDVGRKRASQLAARESLSLETVKRMYSFFSRHEVDKQGKDFDNLIKPSPGRVAWDAWGGDAGYSWARRIVESNSEKGHMATETALFVPILKSEKQADGTLLVHGIATDTTLDSDEQVCDAEWLKSAMPDWFRWGNIREQHSHIAAGVAEEYKADGDQHFITARVVDPSSVKKVETGVLKGFSIGIQRARIATDEKAPGGRICGGTIVEVSLVDRPANPTATFTIAKSVGGELQMLEKREVSAGERESLAESGEAMPDGSYPIANREDLKNAILAYGRAKNPEKVKEHIIRRARALEATGMLPDKWLEGQKMAAEETEKCDEGGFERKAAEETTEETTGEVSGEESSQAPGEESSQKPGEESSRPGGIAGVAGKAADASCPTCEKMYKMVEEMHGKMCKSAEESTGMKAVEAEVEKSQSEDIVKAIAEIGERLSDIEKTASAVNAPVRMAVGQPTPKDEGMVAKARDYRVKAMSATDPRLAEGYLALAQDIEKSL